MKVDNGQTKYVGAAAGLAAGVAVGASKANKLLGSIGITKGMNVDQYVNKKAEEAIFRLSDKGFKSNKVAAYVEKVAEKASSDFASVVNKASKTKVAWAAGLGLAGLAIGTVIGAISKAKAEKANQ